MNGGGLSVRQALGLILVVAALGLVTDPEPGIDPLIASVALLVSGLALLGIDLFRSIAEARRRDDFDNRRR